MGNPGATSIYVETDDVSRHLKRAEAAGGSIVMPETEIMGGTVIGGLGGGLIASSSFSPSLIFEATASMSSILGNGIRACTVGRCETAGRRSHSFRGNRDSPRPHSNRYDEPTG